MTTYRSITDIASIIVSAAALAACGWLGYAGGDRSWAYVVGAIVVACAWLLRWINPASRLNSRPAGTASPFVLATFWAPLLILIPAAATLLALQEHNPDLVRRITGVATGLVVVAFSNGIPKEAASALRQRAGRLFGWMLVIGGLGYALAWLLAPLAIAAAIAGAWVLFSLAGALVGVLRMRARD